MEPRDQDNGPSLIAIYWVFCSLGVVMTVLRFHSQRLVNGLGRDDWAMAVTTVCINRSMLG